MRTTHGKSKTRTYKIWKGIWKRCVNPNAKRYEHYGGRGITVDPKWKNFQLFLDDMGECPDGLTIERKDNDGNYCKDNCKWATQKEQQNNRRPDSRVFLLAVGDKMISMRKLALACGIPAHVARKRFKINPDYGYVLQPLRKGEVRVAI